MKLFVCLLAVFFALASAQVQIVALTEAPEVQTSVDLATVTEEVTTRDPTTQKLTTEKLTRAKRVTEPKTTREPTTEKLTTEKLTRAKRVTEPKTTREPTTEKLTTEKLTRAKRVTEPKTTREPTTEKLTTEKLTRAKRVTEPKTTKQPTTEKVTTGRLTKAKRVTEQETTRDPTTERLTTEKLTRAKPGSRECRDKKRDCAEKLLRKGECDKRMKKECKLSCGLCVAVDASSINFTREATTERMTTEKLTRAKRLTRPKTTEDYNTRPTRAHSHERKGSAECKDKKRDCVLKLLERGECDRKMKKDCKLTCGICQEVKSMTTEATTADATRPVPTAETSFLPPV